MIETIRRMSDREREAVADVAILVAAAAFILGWSAHILTAEQPKATWQDTVNAMPAKIKEDIAIDFCISHKRMCRNLPLSSPVNPKD